MKRFTQQAASDNQKKFQRLTRAYLSNDITNNLGKVLNALNLFVNHSVNAAKALSLAFMSNHCLVMPHN